MQGRGLWMSVIAIGSVAVVSGCSNSSASSGSGTTQTAAATPAVATPVAYADCSAVEFGPPLAPIDPPANPRVYSQAPAITINPAKLYQGTITTAKGKIVLCLQPNLAPTSANNFVTLARNKFYDGLTFHRVVPDFVIQGGDPKGTGEGGPGYEFADEQVKVPYVDGAVAMANSGPNTNGSQFFIDIADNTRALQPLYNVFGKVSTGLDVAKKIKVGDVMTSVMVSEQQ